MYLGHKHVETEPSGLRELAIQVASFKYHMPLKSVSNSVVT